MQQRRGSGDLGPATHGVLQSLCWELPGFQLENRGKPDCGADGPDAMIAPVAEARVAANRTTGSRWAVLGHPLFTGSVFALALNDQVLKERWPGLITGKLSDVAGVVMLAVLLGALTRSVCLGSIITAVAFTALKLIPGVAELATPMLGGVTRRDPTDLLAILVLVLLVRWMKRAIATGSADRRIERAAVLIRALGLVCAVVATSATSCETVDYVHDVVADDGVVWAKYSPEYAPLIEPTESTPRVSTQTSTSTTYVPSPLWVSSTDGGRTWSASGAPPEDLKRPDQTCLDSGLCFRLLPGEAVQQARIGEPWTTSFTFTAEEAKRLKYSFSACGASRPFESLAIVGSGDDQTVVVAMSTQGALVRDPPGMWQRVTVLDIIPPDFGPPVWHASLLASPLVLLLASPAFLITRLKKRRGGVAAIVSATSGLTLSLVASALIFGDARAAGPVIASVSLVTFVASCVVASRRTRERPSPGSWGWPPPQPENRAG
jgi:hypothetical protein